MEELNKKLTRKFSKFGGEQKRLLTCVISSHVTSVLYPEKETYFEKNLRGLDKTSLEWLAKFLTSHLKGYDGS